MAPSHARRFRKRGKRLAAAPDAPHSSSGTTSGPGLESRSRIALPAGSLDHFVGAHQDRRWHDEAERFGSLEIYDQLECGRLLHRQISGLGAVQNPAGVDALEMIGRRKACGDPEQTTSGSEAAILSGHGRDG